MQWNDETRSLVVKSLMNAKSSIAYGANCVFVPINKKYGVKLYMNLENRDFSFFSQRRAAKAGVGPNVGGQIGMGGVNACVHHGHHDAGSW